MRNLKTLFFAAVVALAGASNALAQKYPNSPAQQLFDQAGFYLEFQYNGPSTVNLRDLIAKYQLELDKVCEADGDKCGYEKAEPLLAEMFAEVKDDHAYYLSSEDVAAENATRSGTAQSPSPRVGFTHTGFAQQGNERGAFGGLTENFIKAVNDGTVKLLSNDRLVTNVLPGSPGEKAGLMANDRWIGYDGTLFASVTNFNDYVTFFNKFGEKIRASETVQMNVLRGTERKRVDISVKGEIVNLVNFPKMRILENGVALLSVPDFLPQGVGQRVHDLVREAQAKNAKAIVVDMRGNGGGLGSERFLAQGAFIANPEPMRRIPRYNQEQNTVEETYANGTWTVRDLKGNVLTKVSVKDPVVWTGPMAMLVDDGCASACEYFASGIQRAKRGPVIGVPTVGIGNTNTARFGLVNGAAAGVPTVRAAWPDGTLLPAKITPDVSAATDYFSIFETGKDDGLAKALEVLGIK